MVMRCSTTSCGLLHVVAESFVLYDTVHIYTEVDLHGLLTYGYS